MTSSEPKPSSCPKKKSQPTPAKENSGKKREKTDIKCYECGKIGHARWACPLLKEERERARGEQVHSKKPEKRKEGKGEMHVLSGPAYADGRFVPAKVTFGREAICVGAL